METAAMRGNTVAVMAKATATSKYPFHTNKVVEQLAERFIGREEVLRAFLDMLRVSQTMFMFGRCRDKEHITRAACSAAGVTMVYVDCTLLESTSQLFEYILSRVHIALNDSRNGGGGGSNANGTGAQQREHTQIRRRGTRRQEPEMPLKLTGRRVRSDGDCGGGGGGGGSSNSSNSSNTKRPRHATIDRCAKVGAFVRKLSWTLRWKHKRRYRDKLVAFVFRCGRACVFVRICAYLCVCVCACVPVRVRVCACCALH